MWLWYIMVLFMWYPKNPRLDPDQWKGFHEPVWNAGGCFWGPQNSQAFEGENRILRVNQSTMVFVDSSRFVLVERFLVETAGRYQLINPAAQFRRGFIGPHYKDFRISYLKVGWVYPQYMFFF